jgi:signal peptidase II
LKLKYKVALAFVPALVILDQVTKTIMREILSPLRVIPVIPGFLQFQYAENTGMAFGMLQDLPLALRTPFFFSITLVAVAIIAHLFRQSPPDLKRLPLALSCILSGALGNLIDRFRWGVVVDFIKAQIWPPSRYYWPTFNLADTFITMGIALLILDTLLAGENEAESKDVPAHAGAENPGERSGTALDHPGNSAGCN